MSKKEIRNIPELRFPEFEKEDEWNEETLIGISDFINEKTSLDKLSLSNYISTENLLADFAGVKISSKLPDTKTVTAFKENDILISNIRPYLNKIWSATFEGGASNDVLVIRAKEQINNKYLASLLMNEKFINYVMKGAKGVKMPRGDISLIKKYPLSVPVSDTEQKKIADCLSSIDNLISSQTKKVEVLKEHKKGLMQNLFPTDGENVPKFRFPEFENEPMWDRKTFNKISDNLDNLRIPLTANMRIKGSIPYYGASGIIDYVKDFIFNEDLLCISEDGANLVVRTYPIAFSISGKTWVNNHAHVLKFKNKYTQIIVENYLNFIKIDDYLTGMAQPKLNKAMLNKIPIPLPEKKEQEKIAKCLSSIDNNIESTTKKVEELKAHKKGLTQQLFPNSEVNQ